MDPYKLLGVSERKIKHESDLQPVRKRAKTLYKRFCQEKKKFDAKKVLEAFDLIKKKVKGRLGEGANKILGRSRMERMMDKHYNRQTKEIKKDKRVRKELKKARKGEERFHLPGDKERIYTHKQLKHKRRRRRTLGWLAMMPSSSVADVSACSPTSSEMDAQFCRVCLAVGDEPLVKPCACQGANAYAHASCLLQAFETRACWWDLSCPDCEQAFDGQLAVRLGEVALAAMDAEVDPEEKDEMRLRRADVVTYLGSAYGKMGNHFRQRDLLERALAIKVEVFGGRCMEVAPAMTNLSDAFRSLGRHEEEQRLLEKVLKIQRSSKSDAPATEIARILTSLGNSYGAQGNYTRQRGFLESALEILQREKGRGSPETADVLAALADAYGCLGYSAKKRDMLEQAIGIQERVYGESHPVVATSKYNLAHALLACGEQDNAVGLMENTVVQLSNCYGPDHRHTESARSAVALWQRRPRCHSRPACPQPKPWLVGDRI